MQIKTAFTHARSNMRLISPIFLITFLFVLSACAPRLITPPPLPAVISETGQSEDQKFWWGCRFKVAWDLATEPNLTIDLLLAQAVVGPVLETEADRLSFWRFHRRAAPDASGHQFSFLFYSEAQVLQDIATNIQQNPVLHQALEAQTVERLSCDDPKHPSRPKISAMSDAHWSPELQKHWPSFIMGVSRLWLGLINEVLADTPPQGDDFSQRLAQIRKAEEKIKAIWYQEGQHAFFHHLSAVFGYEPLLIRKEIRF